MLNVALTGNIAAGKSSVVERFRRWGATVVDADELARDAQAPGSAVLAAIAQRFGADVLAADGSLDRAALRAKVMGDDAALAALNAIVHPAVRRRRDELHRAAEQRGDLVLVIKTYSGTPQGGILSPLLANIYLHELDKFVLQLKMKFDRESPERITPEYRELHNEIKRISHRLKKLEDRKSV